MKKPFTSPDRPDLFASLFANAKVNCVIIMDEHGRILQINEAFKNAFGYNEPDIIGKHVRMLFIDHDRKALRPEMELQLVRKQGFSSDQNYCLHKNGQPIWVTGESVWVESAECGNCIVKCIQNIHAQKLQEKFLQEANEFSHTIFETIEDAMVVINMDLVILKTNASLYRLFNLVPSTLEGTNFPALMDQMKMNLQLEGRLKRIEETGAFQDELEWTLPGGSKRHLRVNGKYLAHTPEQEKRILLLFHDISQEKQSEQQREDLINFVAHELRNPMANLALVLELLPEAVRSNHIEETEDYLEKAKLNLRRMKQVMGELHDVSRAGTGNLTIQKATFNLEGAIREAIDTVRMLFPSHRVVWPQEVNEADISIDADRFRLVQVLNNYLTNAIKYSPGADKVVMNIAHNNGNLVVSVKDFGLGIPPDQLPHVFNKYYRGQRAHKIEGLGLGLYVCKEIITAHGGEVWAVSEEGVGSTFFFSLPI